MKESLHRIQWMLSKETKGSCESLFTPVYGDLAQHNTTRLILDSAGKELLSDVVGEYLDLLETSSAVYEKNGDYATCVLSSGWCRYLQEASWKLCETQNTSEALSSGRWLCHESCWTDAAKESIDKGTSVDIECNGGRRIYGVPVKAGEEIIGAITFGYGDPPQDLSAIQVLAERFHVSQHELMKLAMEYETRPDYLINLAKKRLRVSAHLLGEIVSHKRMHAKNEKYYRQLNSLWKLAQMTDASHKQLCDMILVEIQELTKSQYSFVGFLDDDETTMILHSWSKEAMVGCSVADKPIHYPVDQSGLWSQAIVDRKSLVVNDYNQEHIRKKGLPDGHVPIRSILSVPVLRNNKVAAIAVVANKEAPYTDEDENNVYTFVSNVLLLLEKRTADEALHKAELQYRSILDSMNDATYIASSECIIEYMNPKMIEQVGHDACGEYCYQALYNFAKRCPWCVLDKICQGEYLIYDLEHPVNQRMYSISNSPVHKKDGTVSKLSIFRDETEKKMMESQLNQAQKMESIGRLAGGVAHDLNNLITPILGYSDLVLQDLEKNGEQPGSSKKYIARMTEITQAALRSRDLVRQLLTFSRTQVIEFSAVDLNSVLRYFTRLLRRTIREDIAIELKLSTSLPQIQGNVGQLEQVVMNLAINAQDAMSQGGQLIIETSEQQVDGNCQSYNSGLEPDQYVVLRIKDTGCGMDEKTRERVFEPFFTTKPKERGTGLGMATAYGIIKQHGGSIRVDSEPGKGAVFTIYLPVMVNSGRAVVERAFKHKETGGKETILLVEDNHEVRNLASLILQRQGYSVLVADCGVAALKVAEKYDGTISLVLTDVVMPEMHGKDLSEKIRLKYPDIKTLFMSGYPDDVIACQGVLEKGVNFIEKPFTVRDFAAKVRNVLDGE